MTGWLVVLAIAAGYTAAWATIWRLLLSKAWWPEILLSISLMLGAVAVGSYLNGNGHIARGVLPVFALASIGMVVTSRHREWEEA